jgi:two-component system, OmpR family, phosphate regulon sensor histidine kinase PhoR
MRRLLVVNALIFAVLASAAALAYYGYSYTAEASSRERAIITDTMRELAEEKIAGIETPMLDLDDKLFKSVDPEQLGELVGIVQGLGSPTVFVLGPDLRVLPSGYVTWRNREDGEAFRDFFEKEVVPALNLPLLAEGTRGHQHLTIGGQSALFSYSRRTIGGRSYYIVAEADLNHLVGTVFPVYLGIRTPRFYQVVDENGELVFGTPFRETLGTTIVELPFPDTVSMWKLRVAQRDAGTQAARRGRTLIDIILIGLALLVITSGLAILLYAMRREQRANDMKSEFISNVSHELKTPLSIISMFGEMLASGRVKGPAQATEYAETIWRESVRLARLIDNVLDFAKIERGVDIYEFETGDVGEVVGRAVELSTHRLNAAGMTCATDVAPDLPPARVDHNALTLAVLNLIDNAIKYAAEGKRIEVSVRAAGPRLEIRVKDEGPGIEPDEHERIFERFYRARAVRLKPIRGSGIGLALVERIATAHHGGVRVESTPGRGSTFILWLPAERARTL